MVKKKRLEYLEYLNWEIYFNERKLFEEDYSCKSKDELVELIDQDKRLFNKELENLKYNEVENVPNN